MNITEIVMRAFDKRRHLFDDETVNAFRLFHTRRDGIDGLTIDIYGEFLLVQFYSQDLYEIENEIIASVERCAEMIPMAVRGILYKDRVKVNVKDIAERRKSMPVTGELPPAEYPVLHNGITVQVDLLEGQNTGLFTDMRQVRERLRDHYGEGDSLLNLFCYTGVFSVHALKNGVKRAVNVDISRGVLRRAEANYLANSLLFDDRDFVYGDAMDWIRRFRKRGRTFSFAVVDPPTFSRSGKRTFSVKKQYREMLRQLHYVVPEGHVLTAVNTYTVSPDEFFSWHPTGWERLWYMNESEDYMPGDDPYLKVALWRVR